MKSLLCISVLLLLNFFSFSQNRETENQKLIISGVVKDAQNGYGLSGLMIVNKRSHTGVFGDSGGEFTITAYKTDSLKFSVVGYETQEISFRDSVYSFSYFITIKMNKLYIELEPYEVFPLREFSEIKKDIEELGVEYDYQVKGLEGAFSPITFFYERFSRFEKQKKKAAELYNEEAKNDILKELFRKFIRADIIELTNEEFDNFILFCSLPEDYIKSVSQYDLIMAVKKCYETFLEQDKKN